jgi:hypothetical protein
MIFDTSNSVSLVHSRITTLAAVPHLPLPGGVAPGAAPVTLLHQISIRQALTSANFVPVQQVIPTPDDRLQVQVLATCKSVTRTRHQHFNSQRIVEA